MTVSVILVSLFIGVIGALVSHSKQEYTCTWVLANLSEQLHKNAPGGVETQNSL